LKDVVRTRIYTTDINNWEKVGKARAELFKEIHPDCTLVEIHSLINPEILVEIEVDADMMDSIQIN
jgi:enamine deaminase RidA (YjgF/YER057c/UK114 family)